MSALDTGLALVLALAATTIVAAWAAPDHRRAAVAGTACTALGLAGAVTGLLALAGATGSLTLPGALPTGGGPGLPTAPLALAPDRLGGVIMAVAGAVGAACALYGIGYARGPVASRTGWTAFGCFLLGLLMVPAAGDVVTFALAWEVMAIASTVLVLADHAERPQVRSAALWYAVMTQLSLVLLLAGFGVLVSRAGSTTWAAIAASSAESGVTGAGAGTAFVLLSLGFATKAGLVPLHVWLPRAHPEAPSHVSALMSAAMVNMGVYGLLLVVVRLLPGGPRWWGLLLLALGAVSAVYGILQASVASDLKRLLAYSTTENVGLMTLAVGLAVLLRADGGQDAAEVADLALLAALLLVVGHAAFKTALFLAAGSVVHATGERSLDRLGGLGGAMPWTSAAFAAGALGAAALPVSGGFVAEWVLLQSLIHASGGKDTLTAVVAPLATSLVALTAGLALLTFVKAHGIAFLARPRSAGALGAHECGTAMRAALTAAAVAVVALGLAPGPLTEALARAVGAGGVERVGWWGVSLPAVDAALDPLALTLLGLAVSVPVLATSWWAGRRLPRRDVDLAWGCGGVRTSPRMQYTATSYAEPLVRIFDDALQPVRDLEVDHRAESRYLVQRVQFRQELTDVVEDRGYLPVVSALDAVADRARRIQNGSIHRYLLFSFVALVGVLVVVAL